MVEVGRQTPHAGALTAQQTRAPLPQRRPQASEDYQLYKPSAVAPNTLLVKVVDAVPKNPQLLPQPLPFGAPLQGDSVLISSGAGLHAERASTAIVPATVASKLNAEGNQLAVQGIQQELNSAARQAAITKPVQKGARRVESLLAAGPALSLGTEERNKADIMFDQLPLEAKSSVRSQYQVHIAEQQHHHPALHSPQEQPEPPQTCDNNLEPEPEPQPAMPQSAAVATLAPAFAPAPAPAVEAAPAATLAPAPVVRNASPDVPLWTPDPTLKPSYTAEQVRAIAMLVNPAHHRDEQTNAQMQDIVVATFASTDEVPSPLSSVYTIRLTTKDVASLGFSVLRMCSGSGGTLDMHSL